ncbi:hypothetical protein CNBJ1350 [Cryptococcus deneoformans B-3501A]|uniref:Stress-response A/B barrel domain-containing protein n=3 Tax=Cryptococcus neoformans species complex TaxID=1897064 RepID=Q5KAD2_CRYD1|nr:hypothetical protein CNJ02120 [Cryptococcus neoformans var. neoformans JEC21]XP_773140.1 hypothetical protein CNBJ1350 [Cryptococcus neoformans var. neoformans B-3501A]AAW45866.1 hypothetical protein CNJ02120 [Cryptococcus neoformans var. neoformans JEC21]EAL18493.1 hypothetical protein CNBJ1350 [Cryptococcus neoformans var. neoformans B-3501A]
MPKIVHIVLWKLKRPSALTSTSTEEVLAKAKEAINALKNVPGPESVHLGPPLLDARAKGFDYGLYSIFSSAEALQTYAVSEAHVKVVTENVRPNVDDVFAYDFVLEE